MGVWLSSHFSPQPHLLVLLSLWFDHDSHATQTLVDSCAEDNLMNAGLFKKLIFTNWMARVTSQFSGKRDSFHYPSTSPSIHSNFIRTLWGNLVHNNLVASVPHHCLSSDALPLTGKIAQPDYFDLLLFDRLKMFAFRLWVNEDIIQVDDVLNEYYDHQRTLSLVLGATPFLALWLCYCTASQDSTTD